MFAFKTSLTTHGFVLERSSKLERIWKEHSLVQSFALFAGKLVGNSLVLPAIRQGIFHVAVVFEFPTENHQEN
jgi:hypothetical protein